MIGKLSPDRIRNDFQILNKGIIYFDSACMTLKPKQVIEKMKEYYDKYTACAGRSSHRLATEVETEVLKARKEIQNLITANYHSEIVFTRNTTEGINLVSNSVGLEKGDEVIISDKEHNSNLIPWLKLAKKGIIVNVVDSNSDNTFNFGNFEKLLNDKTKIVSIVHASNLDGVINPIKEITKLAHDKNSLVMVDGAQSVPNHAVNVKKLDVDFLCFSGHKMMGPTGTGILYGKKELLENMDQFMVGGETVMDSTYEDYKVEEIPMKFEAGLQDYAGIIGLGEACRYLNKIGFAKILSHEIKLNKIMTEELLNKVELIGPEDSEKRAGIFSFNIKGVNPHNVSKMLDSSKKIMTRSGAHCVHSWFNKHKIDGSVRASLYAYNTEEEIQTFVDEIKKIINF